MPRQRVRLWCDRGSDGLSNLKQALVEAGVDCKRIKVNSTTYRPRADHLIINWGNSSMADWFNVNCLTMLNSPADVAIASNKLKTFRDLGSMDVSIPDIYTFKHEAEQLISSGKKIYCRTKLTGHSGDGIIVARTVEELVPAPLYTVGIEVRGEYRVHVFDGKVIDVTKKRKRTELQEQEDGINYDIRNLSGGWVFCHNNITEPDGLRELATQAVAALGLDFGAVDIVEERQTHNLYVLEINTAPGLSSPTTLNAYVEAIKSKAGYTAPQERIATV